MRKFKFAPGILAQMCLEVKLNFRNIVSNNFFDPRPFKYVKMDSKFGQKYKGFSKFLREGLNKNIVKFCGIFHGGGGGFYPFQQNDHLDLVPRPG